jgi:hypothetical protein
MAQIRSPKRRQSLQVGSLTRHRADNLGLRFWSDLGLGLGLETWKVRCHIQTWLSDSGISIFRFRRVNKPNYPKLPEQPSFPPSNLASKSIFTSLHKSDIIQSLSARIFVFKILGGHVQVSISTRAHHVFCHLRLEGIKGKQHTAHMPRSAGATPQQRRVTRSQSRELDDPNYGKQSSSTAGQRSRVQNRAPLKSECYLNCSTLTLEFE